MCKLFLKDTSFYCFEKENIELERKSARIRPIDIIKHLVAFANTQGGELVIGIEDNGTITGFNYNGAHKIDEYRNILLTELKETPLNSKFNIIKSKENNDLEFLVISIDVSLDRVIKSYDGRVYLRQNSNTKELNFEQILQLQYDRGQRFFENEIVENATLEDLDEEVLKEYKKNMNATNLSNEEVLRARNFLINENITNAAILLFGKNPTKFLPQARLRIIKYEGKEQKVGTSINIIKEKNFESSIPNIIRDVSEFIKNNLREFQYLDLDGKFKMIPEYPEFAWFEGIVNALTHRNYSIRGDHIKVLMFDDRIEIISPGLLPNIVSLENISYQRYSRNPRIARVLSEFGWVKELNEGVKRIYSEMENMFLRKPTYYETNSTLILKLENNIFNRRFRIENTILKKISNMNLNVYEKEILYHMFNSGEIMTTKKVSKIIGKGITTSNKLLKKLEKLELLKWNGTSRNDRTQYYTIEI